MKIFSLNKSRRKSTRVSCSCHCTILLRRELPRYHTPENCVLSIMGGPDKTRLDKGKHIGWQPRGQRVAEQDLEGMGMGRVDLLFLFRDPGADQGL